MLIRNVAHSGALEKHEPAQLRSRSLPKEEDGGGSLLGADSKIGATKYHASVMKYRLNEALTNSLSKRRHPQRIPPRTFVDDNGISRPSDPVYRTSPPPPGRFDSPQVAAQFLKYHPEATPSDFQGALYSHRNDADWLQAFFRALGPEKTARLMGLADVQIPDHQSSKLLADVLTNMVRSGKLSQGDLDKLVSRMAAANIDYRAIARIFDRVPNTPEGEKLKNMFSDSAMAVATGTRAFKDAPFSADVRDRFAALATRTLASTSRSNQVGQLRRWRSEMIRALGGSSAKERFDDLLKGAMGLPHERDFGRVTDLLKTLATAGGHYEGSTYVQPLLPARQLTVLRRMVFNSAALALSDKTVKENFGDNVAFKDAMSSIFTSEFDAIVRSGFTQGPYANVLDNDFRKGLENFFQTALFSERPATSAKSLLNFVGRKLNEIAVVIDKGNQADLKDLFGGLHNRNGTPMTKKQLGGIMGQLLGTVGYAYKQYEAGLEDKGKGGAAAAGFVIDIIAGAIGAGAGEAGPLVGALTGLISSRATAVARDGLSQAEIGKLKKQLANKYDERDPIDVIRDFVEQIANRFREGQEFSEMFSDVSGITG